jgi:hypothetical protein
MMSYILAVACCVTLTAGDLSQLRQLQEKDRIFDLRDALGKLGGDASETLLYRAIVDGRFGHEREAVEQFRAFLARNPGRDLERVARYELSSALTRLGKCNDAAAELAAALRLTPPGEAGRADIENGRALLLSVSGLPAQTVEFGPPTPVEAHRNELGLWTVPVEINSQRGDWLLDTGASLSTVSESEARRMGLAIRETHGYALGSTQARNPVRLGVAADLRLGSARIHNVVFFVLADDALRMPPLKRPLQGILGMPELRALGCLELSAQGTLTIGCSAQSSPGRPNFFLRGLMPVVQVVHSGHNLQMALDTGARATVLYPSFRDAMAQWEQYQLAAERAETFSGAGGSAHVQARRVSSIQLDILGRALFLQAVSLLSQAPPGAAGDGVLGIDAVAGGFRLDFGAMQFALK